MMFTKYFFNLLSDFGDEWVITKLDTDVKSKEVRIYLKYIGDKYNDPFTEEEVKLYDHGPQREWRHLDVWDYKTYVVSRIPRVICTDGQVRNMRLGWSDSHDRHTYSFEIKIIETLKATKNQTKTA